MTEVVSFVVLCVNGYFRFVLILFYKNLTI